MQRFPEAVRKRFTVRSILSVLPALAVLWYLSGGDTEAVLFGGVGLLLAGVLGAVIDIYEVDRRVFKLLFGLIVLAAGILTVQDGTWPTIAFIVGGGWLVLDTVYDYRHRIERRESTGNTSPNTAMRDMQDRSRIAQPILGELREYAKTRDELHAALDEDDDEIDDALDRLQRSGIVEERGGAYRVNENRLGFSAFFRKIASRIARPFTISA